MSGAVDFIGTGLRCNNVTVAPELDADCRKNRAQMDEGLRTADEVSTAIAVGTPLQGPVTGGKAVFKGVLGLPAVLAKALQSSSASEFVATDIRLSQTSVNNAASIVKSMRSSGWKGAPIDVVRMPDGGLTAIDNTRVIAARHAGIPVRAKVREFDDVLPAEQIGRFTTRRGGVPSTWGQAVQNRIGAQARSFRSRYPNGSPLTGWNGE